MSSNKKLVSIIVVNYNGKKWLKDFFNSIQSQTYKEFEVIFVDNNSSDGSVKYVKDNFSEVKVVELEENLGFAGGNNKGFEESNGDLILFLNNDTYFNKNFLKNFIKVFDDEEISIAQSKIVLTDEKTIDSCGSFWTDTTFMYYYGNGKDASLDKYNKPFKVFSIKGASFMVRREVIEEVGLFDKDFWNYYEETDFCHRAWLVGYESWYYPNAVCFHAMGGTSLTFPNDYIQFHNFKNKLMSFLKNMGISRLIYVVPTFILFNALISLVWLAQGKLKHSLALTRAFLWNVVNFGKIYKKRKRIQELRMSSDKNINSKVKVNPHYIYYLHLLNDELDKFEDTKDITNV